MFSTKRKDSFSHGESSQGNTQACSLGVNTLNGTFIIITLWSFKFERIFFYIFLDDIRTPYGSGGQSPPTSETNEDVPKLSSKTSLTPSDAHKVVIEVSDSDAENAKGNFNIRLIMISYMKINGNKF